MTLRMLLVAPVSLLLLAMATGARTEDPWTTEAHPLLLRDADVQQRTYLIDDLRSARTAPPWDDQWEKWGEKAPQESASRFRIILAPEGTLLLDSREGHTWRLEVLSGQKPLWQPIERASDY